VLSKSFKILSKWQWRLLLLSRQENIGERFGEEDNVAVGLTGSRNAAWIAVSLIQQAYNDEFDQDVRNSLKLITDS
jgi:hypothetical protein